jgi:hypothetical protein
VSAPTGNVQTTQATIDALTARLQAVYTTLKTSPPPSLLPLANFEQTDDVVADLETLAGITPVTSA